MSKALVIGNFTTGWDGSICDEKNILDAFRGIGWEATPVQRNILEIPEDVYDIGIIAQWQGYPPDIIRKMREAGVKTVIYWAFDYHGPEANDWHYKLASDADIFLSKEMEHRKIYEEKGANFHWFSQDSGPDFLDKFKEPVDKDMDVLFTGSFIGHAKERIEALQAVEKNFDLTVHSVTQPQWSGAGIVKSREPLMDWALPKLYARAKIVLSVDWVISEGYWSDRNAQAMACGAFVLSRYVPLIESRFGDNVDYFHNNGEMLEKIKYWLEHEEERQEVAERGYTHAKNNLTVSKRVKDLLQVWRDYENSSV